MGYYDFRSDNEKRRSDALDLQLAGTLRTGSVTHSLSSGVLFTRFESRLGGQAYNWVGVGDISGTAVVPPNPTNAPRIVKSAPVPSRRSSHCPPNTNRKMLAASWTPRPA